MAGGTNAAAMTGLDKVASKLRLAKDTKVQIVVVEGGDDEKSLREMLGKYIGVLDAHEQKEEADAIRRLLRDWQASFVKAAVPKRDDVTFRQAEDSPIAFKKRHYGKVYG